MLGLVAGVGAGVAFAALVAVAERATRRQVRWSWLLAAVGLLLAYWAVVILGAGVQEALPWARALRWNWTGKAISTLVTLAAAWAILRHDRAEAGLTLRQAPGSLGPAVLATGLLCALAWACEAMLADGRDLSGERLAFQALMPGLDEELFFRGLLLAALTRAMPDRWRLLGAPVGPAGLIVTFIFAVGHGVGWADGRLTVDLPAFALTGALGAGLLWLRQRTGGVVAPIIAHNLINLGNSFF